VANVVERLVQAHDSGVEVLVEEALEYLKGRIPSFQVSDCGLLRVCSDVWFRDRLVHHTSL
jgi:hypothetical protein